MKSSTWIFLCLSLAAIIAKTNCLAMEKPPCFSTSVQNDIYRTLHDTIKEHMIGCESARKHIEMLGVGKSLKHEDFYPGIPSRANAIPSPLTQFGHLPLSIVEKALPIVDKIFPGDSIVKPVPVNTSNSSLLRDYNFDSLSSTFKYILEQMMVTPKNFTNDELLRAKYYLQELVPNPENALERNASSLPRFILYDYYRARYLVESGKRDSEIEAKRLKLTQQLFREWGHKELPPLISNAEAAYLKWQVFGYKTEIENQLQHFDMGNPEDRLMRSRALFRAAERFSELNPHFKVHPMTFNPEKWHNLLKSEIDQSADELRYLKSLLQGQAALLNASRNELHNITSKDIEYTLKKINASLDDLGIKVKNAVDKLTQFQIECFTRVNASACSVITNGETVFKFIIDKIAEHYEQAAYLESVLESRNETIIVLGQKLNDIASDIKVLDSRIGLAERRQIEDDTDISAGDNFEVKGCPTSYGKTLFTYETEDAVLDEIACSGKEAVDIGNDTLVPYCMDERIPINSSKRLLWNLASCSVDLKLKAFNSYNDFVALMNNATAKISATLTKVDIKRTWFDEAIFKDWEHFTLKKGRGFVSPGPLEPARHFHEVVRSGQYLMPQYTTSFILATDVKIFYPGLGMSSDSDEDEDANTAANIIMKYAYASNLEGGYGPFSFARASGTKQGLHNFRVDRTRAGINLSIPGAQIVAYITSVIPRFPADQPPPPNAEDCIENPALRSMRTSAHRDERRHRRSVQGVKEKGNKVGMMELANQLFSHELTEVDSFLHRTGLIKNRQGIRELINDVTEFRESFEQMVETISSGNKFPLFTTEAESFISSVTQSPFTTNS